MYILSQTFYIDSQSVSNAGSVFLANVKLFFKAKPKATNNSSGITNPGVTLSILNVLPTGEPDTTSEFTESVVNVPYADIVASDDGSIDTIFEFNQPVSLFTDNMYAIKIKFDDPDYKVWIGTIGDKLVGTNSAFPGFSGSFQGKLYDYVTSGTVTPRAASQLKFTVDVAKFTANNATYEMVNKNLEFFSLASQTGDYMGGEKVFQLSANATGNVSISANSTTLVGNGTSFLSYLANNTPVVAYANSSTFVVRNIVSIANNTYATVDEPYPVTNATTKFFKAPVGKVYHKQKTSNTLYLVDSTANSTLNFAANGVVKGELSGASGTIGSVDNLPVSYFNPEIGITALTGGSYSVSYNFSDIEGGFYKVNTANEKDVDINRIETVTAYNALLMSRSNEVTNSTYLYNGNKSGLIKIRIEQEGQANSTYGNVYSSPFITQEKLDVFSGHNIINNDYTSENGKYGNALSKHITTKLVLDSGVSAEDAILYMTANKPAGTDLIPFIKIYNNNDNDAFDDKDWTQLVPISSGNTVSSANGYIDLTYGLPSAPPSEYTANGTVSTTLDSNIIAGSNTNFDTELNENDVVKIWSPLFPTNYQVALVESIGNSTSLVINSPVSNSSIVGDGFLIDKISDPYTAFVNPQNSNVVRYYNSDNIEYDTFNVAQFKIVLVSNNVNITPRISNLRAVAVSA